MTRSLMNEGAASRHLPLDKQSSLNRKSLLYGISVTALDAFFHVEVSPMSISIH
jgi:hypothetical protein